MKKNVLIYGLAVAALVGLLKWLEYRYVMYRMPVENYLGMIAVICTGLGIWMGWRWMQGRVETVVTPAPATEVTDLAPYTNWEISDREYQVLQLMADGLSNQEIADRLFISINTVKTHVSSLYVKLDVKRRTQALQKAKELHIL